MSTYKICIAGSRNFNNYVLLSNTVDTFIKTIMLTGEFTDIEIVSGTAKGADQLGERYAQEHEYSVKQFPAYWGHYGKAAGPIRNEQMASYSDFIFIFWDGKSKGSRSMIKCAQKRKKPYTIIFDGIEVKDNE